MSAITRGVVAAVLLAGAVAGAVAFPRILAGPGGGQTPSFALPATASQPAIVRAQPLPAPGPTFRVSIAPVLPVVHAAHIVQVAPERPKPIVIRRVTPPAPASPKPAPAPT
ncbi:MAG: hypothetical protein ACRDNM_15345, partial [Gaiellaceae bacterium]